MADARITLREILNSRDSMRHMAEARPRMVGRPEEVSIPTIFTSGVIPDGGFIFGESIWGIDSFDEQKGLDAEMYGL